MPQATAPKIDIFPHIFPLAYFERMKAIAQGNPALAGADQALAAHPGAVGSRRAHEDDEAVSGLPAGADAVDAGDRVPRRPGGVARARAHRERRHGRDRRQAPGSLPGVRRLAADEQRAGGARGDGPRDRQARRARACRSSPTSTAGRSTSRSSTRSSSAWRRSTTCRSGCTRRAPRSFPTTRPRPSRSTRSGGCSAGRTRPARSWRGWCSRGMFEKLPKLKIITHHLGAMAPFFDKRIGYGMDQLGSRTADEDYESLLQEHEEAPGRLLPACSTATPR